MFSFSSFGVPIVFGAILLVSMSVGVTCIWDVWRRRGPLYFPVEINLEVPKMWDLVPEDPLDELWRNLQVCPCTLGR
jgi:hypothetical protein